MNFGGECYFCTMKIMAILNLTPDSFWEKSRYNISVLDSDADIIDVGAVSTRPGAADVPIEEEWSRLEPFIKEYRRQCSKPLSIDTTSSVIVRRAYRLLEETSGDGWFIVNDISAGEDDPRMLESVAELGLGYIAMHKKGNPRTMDSLASPDTDIIDTIRSYFAEFAKRADRYGIRDWVLDPGLGFAKTKEQNIEIIERLRELKEIGRPVLIGAADKRFTGGNTEKYHMLALEGGADILRVHDVDAAQRTYSEYKQSHA